MPWHFGKDEKQKSPFEATMPLNTDELKIVEARYNDEPIFFGVGKAKEIKTDIAAEAKLRDLGGSGEYKKERTYEWEYFYNPSALPGFMPIEKAKEFIAGTVSLVSGAYSSPSEPLALTKDIDVGGATISPSRGVVVEGGAGVSFRATVEIKNPDSATTS